MGAFLTPCMQIQKISVPSAMLHQTILLLHFRPDFLSLDECVKGYYVYNCICMLHAVLLMEDSYTQIIA